MTKGLALAAHPGLDAGTLGALRAARAVALARRHGSPIGLEVDDAGRQVTMALSFDPPDARARASWADRDRTTEWAAEAIALEVLHELRGMGAILRAARGTRFDWYVGPSGADFEAAVALEVGGTDERRVEGVLARKLRQIRRRAGGLPGIAAAVQFLTRRAMFRDG